MTGADAPVLLRFALRTHSPFRVASGDPRPGVDAPALLDDPLPASTLKGLMRDSARELVPPGIVDLVFGTSAQPSPFAWTGAVPPRSVVVRTGVRMSIDPDTGTAQEDHLAFGDEVSLLPGVEATFEVEQTGQLPDGLSIQQATTVLVAAAAGLHQLGSNRRRGLGWVGVLPAEGDHDWQAVVERLTELGEQAGGPDGAVADR